MDILKPGFTRSPYIKVLINIGACLDIPTGTYLPGKYGESILNGGLAHVTGIVGIGNNFKSTIMHFMSLSAMARMWYTVKTSNSTFDTEVNIHESRLRNLYSRFQNQFDGSDIMVDGYWTITDATIYYANEWFEVYREFQKEKIKNAAKITFNTPFLDRDGKSLLRILAPNFNQVDSLSRFETEDVAKIQEDNELGDSGGNTIHMRQGLAKKRFLMELPNLTGASSNYISLTAHVGKEIVMASGPMPAPPVKKLQFLKNGDKLKGVTDDFFFLTSNCWHAHSATPLINQGTKAPEYPRHPEDNKAGDTDLNIVKLIQLRSKSGPTGYTIEVIVSQEEGVLPELTEFHFIKENGRWGISGTLQHYSLDLYPDKKVQRTTVRSVIDSDSKFRRALNITSELLQMKQYWHNMPEGLLCTPKELYDDLTSKGYDWNVLLETRGWWTLENDKHPIPFLSTMDLLNMRAGKYKPYWMKDNKK
jgi:hypothetical protein